MKTRTAAVLLSSRGSRRKNTSMESPSTAQSPGLLALRPVKPGDEQLLLEVYASTRADELAQIPWAEAQREAFLRMQLAARDRSYRMYYQGLEDRVILFDDKPAGRLLVVRGSEEFRLADIALLPEYPRAGVGSAIGRAA